MQQYQSKKLGVAFEKGEADSLDLLEFDEIARLSFVEASRSLENVCCARERFNKTCDYINDYYRVYQHSEVAASHMLAAIADAYSASWEALEGSPIVYWSVNSCNENSTMQWLHIIAYALCLRDPHKIVALLAAPVVLSRMGADRSIARPLFSGAARAIATDRVLLDQFGEEVGKIGRHFYEDLAEEHHRLPHHFDKEFVRVMSVRRPWSLTRVLRRTRQISSRGLHTLIPDEEKDVIHMWMKHPISCIRVSGARARTHCGKPHLMDDRDAL